MQPQRLRVALIIYFIRTSKLLSILGCSIAYLSAPTKWISYKIPLKLAYPCGPINSYIMYVHIQYVYIALITCT